MTRKVTFSLIIDGTSYTVNPVWDDSLHISLTKVSQNYRGLREQIDGELVFQREDYALINAQPFETKFTLKIYVNGTQRISGYFYRTYLKVSDDNKGQRYTLAKFVTEDKYERISNGLTNEYNLSEICRPVKVNYFLQMLVQVYIPGRNYLTNINGGNYWEQPVIAPTTSGATLVNTYKFAQSQTVHYIPGRGVLDPDIGGQYFFDGALSEYSNGNYDIRFVGGQWNVYDILNGDQLVYTGTPGQADENLTQFIPVGSSGTTAELKTVETYTRILSNAATIGGTATDPIPDPDITASNPNYTTALPYDYSGIFGSDSNSTEPTQYGQFADDSLYFVNRYFDFPTENIASENYFPVGISDWEEFSIWLYFDATLRNYQGDTKETRSTDSGYLYSDALAAVLRQIDPEVTHQATAAYSDFLYGPDNSIRGKQRTLVLIPKTNITVGDYTQPAKKTPITLQDLFELVRVAHRCDWWIDSSGRLRIEHLSYLQNGGDYDTEQQAFDLTTLFYPKNNFPWTYGTGNYEYELENLPERIERLWSEEASDPFDGLPIQINSVYVNPATPRQERLQRFFPDIDYALANTTNKDGFFVAETNEENPEEYTVRFINVTYKGKQFQLQNGEISFAYTDENFGKYGLPAENVTINGEATTATTTVRGRKASIDYAGRDTGTTDYLQLVKLNIGTGEIYAAKIQMSTGNIEITDLKLPTQ